MLPGYFCLIFYLSIENMGRCSMNRRSRVRKQPERYTPVQKQKVKAVTVPRVRQPKVQAVPTTPVQPTKLVSGVTKIVKKRNSSKTPYVDKYGRRYYTHPPRKNLGLCNPIPEIRPVGLSLRESTRHRFWKICWNNTLTTYRFGGLSGIS